MRLPAPPDSVYSQEAAEGFVGARVYEGQAREREIGFIVGVRRFNRGTVLLAEIEVHDPADLLLAEMRAFSVGASLL